MKLDKEEKAVLIIYGILLVLSIVWLYAAFTIGRIN